jgi:hypothetical protein
LVPHSQPLPTAHTQSKQADYYVEHRDSYLARAKDSYKRRKSDPDKYAASLTKAAEWRKTDAGRAWTRAYDRVRRNDPERRERAKTYHREWYLKKKAAVSGTAAEAVKID